MSNKINTYKIIGDTPSIYAEVDEGLGQFDLTLLVDGEAIEEILNQNSGHVFYVSKPGSYVVSVKYADENHYSGESFFYKQDFIQKKFNAPLDKSEHNDFKKHELLLDNIEDFSITAKIKKTYWMNSLRKNRFSLI